ncbi:MAG: hypothetical protein KGJ19_09450 [Betaproteobacteria bacterium]|nr:hypothetical protein [Betaproteobacteria bacterium]
MFKRLNILVWPIIITVILVTILTCLINAQIIEHDFGKTLSGTFVGAWLAFVSNMFMRYQNQYRDDLAAGRRALFTIRSQIDDFTNYRYAFQHSIAQVDAVIPGAPEWCLAKPMGFNFNSSNVFDYKSLGFLLSKESGRIAYQQLQFVERTYLDLMARHSDLNSSAIDTQKAMSELHSKIANLQNIPLKSLEPHLGFELTYRTRDHLRTVALRVDQDEQRYKNAFNVLNDALKETLSNDAKIPFLEIPDKFKKENLPPLPESLRSYVDQQIGQGN